MNPSLAEFSQWVLASNHLETPQMVAAIAVAAYRAGADQQLELDASWVALQTSNQMSAKRLKAEMRPTVFDKLWSRGVQEISAPTPPAEADNRYEGEP